MGLAAPKNRSRISNDPQNTTWANNTTRFGHRILTNQGWKPGDSLGAQDAAHAQHFTAASQSHIRVFLKDDNLGLGAKMGSERPENFGLAGLESVLGRLNGKGEEVKKEEERRAEIGRRSEITRRYGFMNFVSGGFLVGDVIEKKLPKAMATIKKEEEEEKEIKDVESSDQAEKKSKKRKRSKEEAEEDDKSNGDSIPTDEPKLKRKKKSINLRDTAAAQDQVQVQSEPEPESTSTKSKSKSKSKSKKDKREKKEKKSKSKSKSSSSTSDDDETSIPTPQSAPEPSSSTSKSTLKAEKRARKAEKKLQKALRKAAKSSKPKPSSSDSDSEPDSDSPPTTTAVSSLPTTGTSTPITAAGLTFGAGGRHAVRQRYIRQKMMASMDPQALKEIFMVKTAVGGGGS